MTLFVINDLLFVINQSTTGYLTHVGVAIYISIQSVMISLKFARSHKKVVILSNELLEINENLEAVVEDRTKSLHQANVELGNIGKQKDLLISTISHDLMGFFNTLITFTKALHTDSAFSDSQRKTMTRLYQTSNKGYFLLDNILAWAKLNIKYHPELVSITNSASIIAENLTLYADQLENKSLEAIVEIDDTLVFKCSIENLHSILRNILSNAIKFSEIGGKMYITNELKDNFVQINIRDQGIGMSTDMQQAVFNPELNKRREGTEGERGSGLGLLIVKELVEANKGRINVTSEENRGSCFTIEFPV